MKAKAKAATSAKRKGAKAAASAEQDARKASVAAKLARVRAERERDDAEHPSATGTLLDLGTGLEIRRGPVPVLGALPDGRRVVAWASISVQGRATPRSWVARLSSVNGRLERVFVERARSRKDGYSVTEDNGIITAYFREDYPLVPGVYEATSLYSSGPPGYEGRAAFEVRADGAIDIIAVGPRSRSPSRELTLDLLRRIAVHDAHNGTRHADERDAVAIVRGDELIQRYGLPDLQGSAKQVAWAMDIRRRAFDELLDTDVDAERLASVVRELVDARWWIDHRERTSAELSIRIAQ